MATLCCQSLKLKARAGRYLAIGILAVPRYWNQTIRVSLTCETILLLLGFYCA